VCHHKPLKKTDIKEEAPSDTEPQEPNTSKDKKVQNQGKARKGAHNVRILLSPFHLI